MKNYKLYLPYALSAILLLSMAYCPRPKENPILDEKASLEEKSVEIVPNYDSFCIIGRRYIIFGPKSDNPFEDQAKATVIIVAKQNGYVQYCWDYDVDKKDRCLFTRSCKDFMESTHKN